MGDTISIWLKDYLTSILWVSYFETLGHSSKEKELKIGGANHFLSVQKDDRFKSCFLGSKVWQEGAAVSVPLSPFSYTMNWNQRVTRGLTKYSGGDYSPLGLWS